MNDILEHIGMPRRSGRYPWGSGLNPYQGENWFLAKAKSYKDQGYSDKEIAEKLNMTTTEYRVELSKANDILRNYYRYQIPKMKKEGMSNVDIASELGMTEGNVRRIMREMDKPKQDSLKALTSTLEDRLGDVEYLDIGEGVERQLGVSKERLRTAAQKLVDEEGY